VTPFALFVVFGSACGLCLLLTPLVRAAALRWGLVDEPDGRRKIHPHPIPVAGGVAVLLTAAVVLAGTLALVGPLAQVFAHRWLTFTGRAPR